MYICCDMRNCRVNLSHVSFYENCRFNALKRNAKLSSLFVLFSIDGENYFVHF